VHLCKSFSGGLPNDWVPSAGESFQRDWSEEDMLKSAAAGGIEIKSYVFLECFNRSPADEAKWVQSMVDDPNSKCAAFCAQIYAQHGAAAVTEFLDAVRDESGALPSGLRGARMVFPASDNNAPDACLDPKFHEGLEALQAAGLLWEFCCNPTMAPNLAECCAKFPGMTFVIDHCAHNGNDGAPHQHSLPHPLIFSYNSEKSSCGAGGDMAVWGPAMDKLGALPNCYS
jgi:predicted TIM-barrel fold metal-dependent hydrolase